MNIYRFHTNPKELIHGEHINHVLEKMVRHKLGYTSRFTPTLVNAVFEQFGTDVNLHDTLRMINQYGIDSGFPGFTYYSETEEFYTKNKDEINTTLEHESVDFGYDVGYDDGIYDTLDDLGVTLEDYEVGALNMVISGHFYSTCNGSVADAYHTMYGTKSKQVDTICNCIVWYIVESLASEYMDIMAGMAADED